MNLNNTAIKNSKPKRGPYKLSDGFGLYPLVDPTGSRLWRKKSRIERREKLANGVDPSTLAPTGACDALMDTSPDAKPVATFAGVVSEAAE